MKVRPDQQPIQRTVGRRVSRDGMPLSPTDRAAINSMARYRTRAPKGIYFYNSAAEMDADRQRWQVEAILAKHR